MTVLYIGDHEGLGFSVQKKNIYIYIYHPKTSLTIPSWHLGSIGQAQECLQSGQKCFLDVTSVQQMPFGILQYVLCTHHELTPLCLFADNPKVLICGTQ